MKKIFFVLILALSILASLDLLHPGILVTHDAPDHVARIANFYTSLSEGIIIPRWAANLNWGYGHPILMFLYPLPSYSASVFHAIGLSFVDSTKLVFGITYIASLVTFFLWASVQWNPVAAFVGTMLYGFVPYRFVDLYVRGALGEHVAFVFPPIIFLGILWAAKNRRIWSEILTVFGSAGLLLSHNAVSIMVIPVIAVYWIYVLLYEAKDKSEFLKTGIPSVVMGFLLAAFFWIPAFFEGKYTLRDIVTKGDYIKHFVPFSWFLYSPWNYGQGDELTKEVGCMPWLFVAASVIVWFKSKRKQRFFIGTLLICFFGFLFLMTGSSALVWQKITLLQKFQFPWRFLTVTVLVTAMLSSLLVSLIPKKWYFIAISLALVQVLMTIGMWKSKAYMVKHESYYSGIYNSTTDTGESSPIWSVRFMEHRAAAPMQVISGQAQIAPGTRTTTIHDYTINVQTKSRILENTLYFPGWTVKANGVPVILQFQDPAYRGLMTFWLDRGQYNVRVQFGDTRLRTVSNIISLLSLLTFVLTVTIQVWLSKKGKSR